MPLRAVKFGSDALVRFKKAVIDNDYGGSSRSHLNLLVQFLFWKVLGSLVMIKHLRRSFKIVI